MTFDEVLDQVRELLQQRGRVTYRALKRRFDLDDEYLEDLKGELIKAEGVAADEGGEVLVWTGGATEREKEKEEDSEPRTLNSPSSQTLDSRLDAAERRQLTVLFCDLVGSTVLSERLDPEEYRVVVRSYQETCAEVIRRYAGHTAQHLGDGLLVYFSYPVAHEDDAQRAVRTGLEILAGLQSLNARLQPAIKEQLPHPIQVRIGIHTGLVVIGEIGSSKRREILAMGETPNIAARLQGLAESDTVVISGATYRLVQGLFECQDRGPQELKGISTPLSVYRVVREGEAQSRFEVAVRTGLTPLVGRESELGLLRQRWDQAKAGDGQVVLLSGEPGIGKSRLVQELKEQLSHEGATRIEFRCSLYHQNSALYPIIDHLQRFLQFAREDSPAVKLGKLQHTLSHYRFPQADTLSLLAALVSLPHPAGHPSLTMSPQKQKEKTLAALVAWLVEEAERAAIFCAWEDLHWADPSTLEVLTLLLNQVPTTRLLMLLTFRPEFTPLWGNRSHLSHMTLSRLGRSQIEIMVENVTRGKALPSEVLQQIVSKTDGVPLFVEELTKTVLESGLLREEEGRYVGAQNGAPIPPLAIPSTLQDSLMARLDRLAPVREIAQVGAVLGREFPYEVLHAVLPLDEGSLQQGLRQLVEAELVYQRGVPPQATYLFKHALVQDTAYQSLLKSKRQQLHQQIAQILAARFPALVEVQPELLAHHYTEAGLVEQAIPCWQQAGQRASQRSANTEAISHFTKGLRLLQTLADSSERTQQEIALQATLGLVWLAAKGYTAPEAEKAFSRARELCQQLGASPLIFRIMIGLFAGPFIRGELRTARELGEQLFTLLSQRAYDPVFLLWAHCVLGQTVLFFGELVLARRHLEQGLTLYRPEYGSQAIGAAYDPGVGCLAYLAPTLWLLGYPDQALRRNEEALTRAREIPLPFSLAHASAYAASLHQYRREGQSSQEQAEATIALSSEQGFPYYAAMGTILRGWALAEQGQGKEGSRQICQGLDALQAMGVGLSRPSYLAMLAEAYGKEGQATEGLKVLAEALAMVNKNGESVWEAELYRLKGELLLVQEGYRPQAVGCRDKTEEAEACFLKAIEVARKQQAKSLELRAVMSLAKLWQRQGKQKEAHEMLAAIYNWFTEGFNTKDLQEAKALLDELSERGR